LQNEAPGITVVFCRHAACFGCRPVSRYELEAQELLLRRRNMLRRQGRGVPGGDPAARWTDYEGAPEPVSEVAQRELVEIDAALSRIAEGRYGTCQACGGPMGLQRIRAIPEARFCVGCSGQGLQAD
jgi:hypothetical protein